MGPTAYGTDNLWDRQLMGSTMKVSEKSLIHPTKVFQSNYLHLVFRLVKFLHEWNEVNYRFDADGKDFLADFLNGMKLACCCKCTIIGIITWWLSKPGQNNSPCWLTARLVKLWLWLFFLKILKMNIFKLKILWSAAWRVQHTETHLCNTSNSCKVVISRMVHCRNLSKADTI